MAAWRYEFCEMGGYDCMTDAIRIYEGDTRIADLDLHNYGQPSCGDGFTARKLAEAKAKLIVDAVNAFILRGRAD